MSKIHITTLGCPKNTVDSDHLGRMLRNEGFEQAAESGDADILLVNTCGFVKDAKEESVEEILALAQEKDNKKLLVFGCLAKRYGSELLKEIPEIDRLWGVAEEREIIEYCKDLLSKAGRARKAGKAKEARASISPSHHSSPSHLPYAYLKVAEGCDKKCTFCVIPSIRGEFRSVPHEEVLKEAEEFVRAGVRELILVAQDITSYGKEKEEYDLVTLLKGIAAISGDFSIRLLYLYPTAVTDELLDLIASEDKIQKYLDIPLQHSEDRLLRLMGRRGTRKEYLKLLKHIRRRVPAIALRTTFIVGFPTETEEEFNGMMDFIEEVKFERLGAFIYSKEEGTPAAKLKGQIPEKTKLRRLDEIMKSQALISLEKNRELVGKSYRAIVDEIEGETAFARLYSHAPEIDGSVIIEDASGLSAGDVVMVEITDAYDYDLKGRVIKQ